ncbi:cell division topological specificity factor MinE [Microvirga massiliensis]|uniref:cell division topological specificity factor MinE n=1 Tax=Microvirga massiliensis TaxID=1033741 RepID=UPI00062B4186|nr:cell division topological specificity factor MinE [Microvirga massiliensis]
MNILNFFQRKNSAPVARERLQILLAHERGVLGGKPELVSLLQEEILAVIAKHVAVDKEQVQIRMDRGDALSTLEIEVEIPNQAVAKVKASA